MGINLPRISPEILPKNLKNLTKKSLTSLREAVETDPSRETIEVRFDLGEFEKDTSLKSLVDYKETSLLQVQASVDSAKHIKRSEQIQTYAENARKIESYSKYFTPETMTFYEKNKQAISDISKLDIKNKDLQNSPEWDQILNTYGDDILEAEGALNFILAFMRATDDTILGKINRGEIGLGFSIDLSLQKGKSSRENRKAVFELRIPSEIRESILNPEKPLPSDPKGKDPIKPEEVGKDPVEIQELDLNQGLINDLEKNPYFFKNNKPDRLAVLFSDKNNHYRKMFEDLKTLKLNNPDFFNAHPDYPRIFKIIGEGLAKYYSGFGAVSQESSDVLSDLSQSLNQEFPSPSDKLSLWRDQEIINWLSENGFSTNLNSNSRDLLLNGKDSLLRLLYNNVFRKWKVSPENMPLFKSINKILQDYEIYYNNLDPEKGEIEAQKYQFQLNRVVGQN